MRNVKKKLDVTKKIQTRITKDLYYTNSSWPIKEIDGVEFIAVTKSPPESNKPQNLHYLRKDSIEYIK